MTERAPTEPTLAVMGGSGLYGMPGLEEVERKRVETPYGAPSDDVLIGKLDGHRVLFLSRHGNGHRIAPHEINYRANICAMKTLGATHLLSASAVGSMQEPFAPGSVVVVDQFIDRTRQRRSTFFGDGVVAHVSLADPVCPHLTSAAAAAAVDSGAIVHRGGTYLCIDGPQFSTRAESMMYRSFGVAVIGMTAMPEARLAREAELPYALLGFVTDYDCWHETEEDVSVEAVIQALKQNAELAQRCIRKLAPHLPDPSESPAHDALRYAVITTPDHIDPEAKERLAWLWRPAPTRSE